MTVNIPDSVWKEVAVWAEKEYPYEGCGLLLGMLQPSKAVARFVAVKNALRKADSLANVAAAAGELLGKRASNNGYYEFAIDPSEINRIESQAIKDGLEVIGIVHTHPDHPARPSSIDMAQPMLSHWSNLIVEVKKGKFIECRSWCRENDNEPFAEEKIALV